jgi:Type IX secretion system membrane protein PorP/SprF
MQLDLNAKVRYRDLVWAGLSYRNKDAMVLMAGATLLKNWDVAYSYDITTSELRKYSGGSHEVIIGYRWVKNNNVKPTSQFW